MDVGKACKDIMQLFLARLLLVDILSFLQIPAADSIGTIQIVLIS